jgi:hypothetical protein
VNEGVFLRSPPVPVRSGILFFTDLSKIHYLIAAQGPPARSRPEDLLKLFWTLLLSDTFGSSTGSGQTDGAVSQGRLYYFRKCFMRARLIEPAASVKGPCRSFQQSAKSDRGNTQPASPVSQAAWGYSLLYSLCAHSPQARRYRPRRGNRRPTGVHRYRDRNRVLKKMQPLSRCVCR